MTTRVGTYLKVFKASRNWDSPSGRRVAEIGAGVARMI